jgi:hypothetical protein
MAEYFLPSMMGNSEPWGPGDRSRLRNALAVMLDKAWRLF